MTGEMSTTYTPKQLAQEFVQRLREAVDKGDENDEVQAIAAEISGLRYTPTDQPVTDEHKRYIVELMQAEFPVSKVAVGYVGIKKEADNKHYLELVRALQLLIG